MVTGKDTSIDFGTTQWARVFKHGSGGYKIGEAYNLSRQERVVGNNAADYQKNFLEFQASISKLPILILSSTHDADVRGVKDHNGVEYGKRKLAALRELNTSPFTSIAVAKGAHCFHFHQPQEASRPIRFWLDDLRRAA